MNSNNNPTEKCEFGRVGDMFKGQRLIRKRILMGGWQEAPYKK